MASEASETPKNIGIGNSGLWDIKCKAELLISSRTEYVGSGLPLFAYNRRSQLDQLMKHAIFLLSQTN
jgi:hypothetical protein